MLDFLSLWHSQISLGRSEQVVQTCSRQTIPAPGKVHLKYIISNISYLCLISRYLYLHQYYLSRNNSSPREISCMSFYCLSSLFVYHCLARVWRHLQQSLFIFLLRLLSPVCCTPDARYSSYALWGEQHNEEQFIPSRDGWLGGVSLILLLENKIPLDIPVAGLGQSGPGL